MVINDGELKLNVFGNEGHGMTTARVCNQSLNTVEWMVTDEADCHSSVQMCSEWTNYLQWNPGLQPKVSDSVQWMVTDEAKHQPGVLEIDGKGKTNSVTKICCQT